MDKLNKMPWLSKPWTKLCKVKEQLLSSPKNEIDENVLPSGHPGCKQVRTLCSEWVPSEWESKQLIKTLQVIYQHISLKMFWTFTWKQSLIGAYFSPNSDEKTFSMEKAILWIAVNEGCFLLISSFSLHKMLIDGLESCGLFVFGRHPFTAEDPLVNKW